MKILAVSHSCVTDVNQELYVALSRIPGVTVELVVPANWKNEYTGQDMTPHLLDSVSFPVHCLPVAVPGHNSLHFYHTGLSAIVQTAAPDVVFVDEEPWSLAVLQIGLICHRLNTPYVSYTKQNIVKRYPLPFRGIEQRTYRSAAAIVALSEEVKNVLRSKGFRGDCPLLAHACDLSLFHRGRSEALRRDLGLEGFVIGFMGRFVPEKGLNTLLAALPPLAGGAREPVTALLIGAGPQEGDLKRRAAALGVRVVFTGAVPHQQAGNFLRCLDVFVLPSETTPAWKEQFGRVIIEAMACGIPVVGSNSGYIPFLIQDTGGGLVFRESDAADLAAKLLCLRDAPEARMCLGTLGEAAVRHRYTYAAIAQELCHILKGVLR